MASTPPSRGSRVAVDSSVYFAAAYSPWGSARELLVWGILGELTLVISDFVYSETEEHLTEKLPSALQYFRQIKEAVGSSVGLPPESLVEQALSILDDPEDAPVVAGAVHGRARYLVSYDRRHLLRKAADIRQAFGLEVVTPEEVLLALGLRSR
jgi:predicted nucleic acid-binding protein